MKTMPLHILGFPRIGPGRELKWSLERYWRGELTLAELEAVGAELRDDAWRRQAEAGLSMLTAGDFAFYDHVLSTSVMLGHIPRRFERQRPESDLDLVFAMARGRRGAAAQSDRAEGAPDSSGTHACELTKWFDTNYHYLVPEFHPETRFEADASRLVAEVREAARFGLPVKAVLLGPVTYLRLGKVHTRPEDAHRSPHGPRFSPLDLLLALLEAYVALCEALVQAGAAVIQLDEPILALDMTPAEADALRASTSRLYASIRHTLPHATAQHAKEQQAPPKLMLTTYFGGLASGHGTRDTPEGEAPEASPAQGAAPFTVNNLRLACELPCDVLHVDGVRGRDDLEALCVGLPPERVLSLGLIDGRNVWRSDLGAAYDLASRVIEARRRVATDASGEVQGGRDGLADAARVWPSIWLGTSCSLLHVPYALKDETQLPAHVRTRCAFALEKLGELRALGEALASGCRPDATAPQHAQAPETLTTETPQRAAATQRRLSALRPEDFRRSAPFAARQASQRAHLKLPLFPTTSIGSFPQTPEVRTLRAQYRKGAVSKADYDTAIQHHIRSCIAFQDSIGIDMPVHGEFERNDMVEFFGEQLEGFAFTAAGWVQSYGSRCVKPPLLWGTVSRPRAMTVAETVYAQSLTTKPVKGMLTGPITLLQWSFVREDQPRENTMLELALAVRDEALDLERAGIAAIQIDEPALREGLPLRAMDWPAYLKAAVAAFRLAAGGVKPSTQVHTHMCYSEFSDIMPAIADLDADVITIETSRSNMDILDAFVDFAYPNEIGPGVYDIHSPRVPPVDEMVRLLERALAVIPAANLWVNPDCGLKTRGWPEVKQALTHLTAAAAHLRATHPRLA